MVLPGMHLDSSVGVLLLTSVQLVCVDVVVLGHAEVFSFLTGFGLNPDISDMRWDIFAGMHTDRFLRRPLRHIEQCGTVHILGCMAT